MPRATPVDGSVLDPKASVRIFDGKTNPAPPEDHEGFEAAQELTFTAMKRFAAKRKKKG